MKLVILAKTYPVPQKDPGKVETVCTGALGEDHKYYRLYPVPYRLSEPEEQYTKWEWIEAELEYHRRDARRETRAPKNLIRTGRRETDNVRKARLLLPGLLTAHSQMVRLQQRHFTICLCRLLNPTLDWVTNENRERHEEVTRQHQNMLFTPEWIDDLKKLEHPPRLLRVHWEDAEGKEHNNVLFEWEYYKVWTDCKRRGMTDHEADDYVYTRSVERRFRTDRRQVWGLFGTHRATGSWLLGAVYSFLEADVEAASSPLFGDEMLPSPYE